MTKEISAKEQEEMLSIYNCKTKTKQTGIVEEKKKNNINAINLTI